MENKNIDTTLNTLRKHSPNWIDEIRNYINRLEKENEALKTLSTTHKKEIEKLNKLIKLLGDTAERQEEELQTQRRND